MNRLLPKVEARPSIINTVIKIWLLALIYFWAAYIGLQFDPVGGFATLVWPPTGLALAAIILLGYRVWPGIFLGATLVNWVTGAPPLVAMGIGVGNTLEAVCGVYLLNKLVRFDRSLSRLQDVLGLVVLVGVVSTTVSATIGVTSLMLGGVLVSNFFHTWVTWWIGDMLGALVVAPFLLVWTVKGLSLTPSRTIEALLVGLLLLAANGLVFGGLLPSQYTISPSYLIFPPLIWIALRFGQKGVTLGLLTTAVFSIWGTSYGFGPFARPGLSESLLLLQLFMAVVATTFLLLAAMVLERQASETEIRRLNIGLEAKVRERTRKLEEAEKAAESQLRREIALEKKERDFIAMASHQLMTPLALVQGYISLIITGKYGRIETPAKDFLKEALAGTKRMALLIKNFLATTKIESGIVKVEPSPFDLAKLVSEVMKDFQLRADSKGLKLVYNLNEPVEAFADRKHAREILTNLLDNAIKFTQKGGITVSVSKISQEFARVEVTDAGIGINRADMPRIFEKFYWSENWVTKQSESTGLGLYIAKSLTELMGGIISVKSQVGKGTTFTFTLPLAKGVHERGQKT